MNEMGSGVAHLIAACIPPERYEAPKPAPVKRPDGWEGSRPGNGFTIDTCIIPARSIARRKSSDENHMPDLTTDHYRLVMLSLDRTGDAAEAVVRLGELSAESVKRATSST